MLLAQEIDKYFTWRPAAEGEEWRVRLLIDHDPAHLNHKDGRFQRTALMTAAAYGHADIVRMLVEDKGAKMNIRDAHGFTALHLAAGMGHANVVAYLLEKGANASIKDQIGWTPLMTAARDGHLNVVRLLVAYKAQDVNEGNASSKRTPLWLAAERGHEEVVRVLVCEGFADVTLCDREGKAPIQVAWERGHYNIAEFLEELIGRSRPCVCLTPRYLPFQLRV